MSPLPLSASPLLLPLLSSLQSSLPLPTSLVVLSLHHPLVVLRKLVIALPLATLPSCPLVVPNSCPLIVLSLHHPLVVSSHWLVFASHFVSPPFCHPLTLPLLLSCAGWLLRCLLSCRPLVVPPSRPLLILSLHRNLVVSSQRPVVAFPLAAPPPCPLLTPLLSLLSCTGWLLRCLPLRRPLIMLPSCPLIILYLKLVEPEVPQPI
jgi:hypothetical protein